MLQSYNVLFQHSNLKSKAEEYRKRALDLQKDLSSGSLSPSAPAPPGSSEKNVSEQFQRAYFLLTEALDLDEDGKSEEAFEAYTQAVELCIAAKQEADEANKKKLSKVAAQALDRAEVLKGKIASSQKESNKKDSPVNPVPPGSSQVRPAFDLLHIGGKDDVPTQSKVNTGGQTVGGGGLSDEEKRVLAVTSRINSREVSCESLM